MKFTVRPRFRLLRLLGVACALLVIGVVSVPPASAQVWTYTVREGDNLWVLAEEYLVSMRHWDAFRAMNPVPDPRRMRPGTKVRFPARWLRVRPAPARVVAVSGQALMRQAGGTESPARVGAELGPGAAVVTGPGASVVVRFADDSQMLVRPASEVVMNELGVYGRRGLLVDTRARLQRGRVEVEVPESPRNRLEITTPSASALVRGTRFRVASEADVSRAEVEEGAVDVAASRGLVRLAAGTGTVVAQGKAPSQARPLLAAPELATVPPLIERRQLRVRWPAVAGAAGYRAQIATTGEIPTLLVDLPGATPTLQLPELPDASYELRVRAVDGEGLEGRSAARVFELNAIPEPPATVQPRPDATVHVATPALRWSEPADAAAYRVQVATDAEFAGLVLDRSGVSEPGHEFDEALAPGEYFWRVASVDAAAEQGPYSDAQRFTVRPAPAAPGEAGAEVGEEEVSLRWQAGQPGQTYEVEIADSEDFTGDTRVEQTDLPQLILPTPDRDIWFRVRVVDTDGYQGPYGTPNRIEAPVEDPWWLLAVPILIILL